MNAPVEGAEFDALAQEVLTDSATVEAVIPSGDSVVLYSTTPDALDGAAAEFEARYANVEIRSLDAPFEAYAEDDVVAGAGYFAVDPANVNGPGGLCSIGFTAWNPDGDPALISAGHCTEDGLYSRSALTLPTGDPAGGGALNNDDVELTQLLADLEFSLFGGAGNSVGTANEFPAADVSAWDVINTDLTLIPAVTDWTTAASEDLSLSATPIRAVGNAQLGSVAKSGRTTGNTTGTVVEVGGWATVGGRQVYGFMSELVSAEGDSGGAIYQGNTAVGILSGGTTSAGVELTWGADLQTNLALTGGYAVALYIDAPVITSGAEIGVGGSVTGTAQANSTLVVDIDGEPGSPFEVAVDANGNWSFPVPAEVDDYTYTIYVQRGFDTSASVDGAVSVLPAAPVITNPTNGARIVSELTTITGTGVAGADVSLTIGNGSSGDSLQTVVEANGEWSVDINAGIGAYTITALQSVSGVDSAVASVDFAVVPSAPTVDHPIAGATFAFASSPTGANGTGTDGATVTVTIDGVAAGTAEVVDGRWAVSFAAPAAGAHTLAATQTINTIASDATSVAFTVAAAPVPGQPGSGGTLPATGMSDITPFLGGGVVLLAAGLALVAFRRARRQVGQL
ncbi:LPXTG cell wall anchor domain-containing protein [Microbacterium sp. NPDC089189]|uniref:LPXTG cell wall anchor domain-containing protein n=1 Tax=Microbacterium sp. NPDC089189 TaxID=3154972 RepID=UPI00342739C4